ncbi:ret finger protein-like 4A [Eptesicus fuscus]|uniref:ret finger protein-like 4A n=1 Tax=Eptesicus fuscus TaxID=29078 RepID=UPI002403D5B7|nr:ret finger protein-like 4A [Eptesicus fuscus]
MAQQFKEAARCRVCLMYLEDPVKLKCGFDCCRRCLAGLPKAPDGEGVLCFNCSQVSRKKHIKPNRLLGRLAAKVKELEPQLTSILTMDPRIRKFRVDMTLDLDTAHNYLVISEDLRRVRIGGDPQGRPAHPGRFNDSPCVLGAARFTSGRHYWEVDVASSREWSVGLCREAAPRQGEVVLSAELGFWTVSCSDGDKFVAGTQPPLGLLVQPRLRRLGLFLDVELETFSFYHAADGSHVFTFPAVAAAEPLRPFFGPAGSSEDGESWLAVCP